MRIPFPERIKPWHAGCFAAILCLFELLEGTHPFFVLCVFAYIMTATVAFNLAGGLTRASGAYILFNALLGILVSLCGKAVLWEPADATLRAPTTTILVYTVSMMVFLFAIAVSRRLLPKVPLLERGDKADDTRQIAVGCLAAGIGLAMMRLYVNTGYGSIGSAINQMAFFVPLGITLAVYDRIRTSGGRSSASITALVGCVYLVTLGGILGTSKQGIFTPLAAYLVACGALRYRFRLLGVATLGMIMFVAVYYMVPYDQVVRNYTRNYTSFSDQIAGARYWLNHMDEVRTEYNFTTEEVANSRGPRYFSEDRGFLERLGMIAMDDALIDITDINGTFGLHPVAVAFENLIPHVIWRNKPDYDFNNTFAHELGLLSYDDLTTGISFGPGADAYHEAGWFGVLLVLPLVMLLLFTLVDSVTGDIRKTPWGLAFTVYFLHAAPEGCMGVCIGLTTIVFILVVTVYAARSFLPVIANIFLKERRRVFMVPRAHSFPKASALNATTGDHE